MPTCSTPTGLKWWVFVGSAIADLRVASRSMVRDSGPYKIRMTAYHLSPVGLVLHFLRFNLFGLLSRNTRLSNHDSSSRLSLSMNLLIKVFRRFLQEAKGSLPCVR